LAGGLFPNTPRSKPLSPELFDQLNAPGVVYYQSEKTGERFESLHESSQLLLMLTKRQQLDGRSAGYKWLTHFAPALGNSVTVATQTSPAELTFTRKSQGGLTAFELLMLVNWLESPRFPSTDLHQPERPRPGLLKRPAAPAPAPMTMPMPPSSK